MTNVPETARWLKLPQHLCVFCKHEARPQSENDQLYRDYYISATRRCLKLDLSRYLVTGLPRAGFNSVQSYSHDCQYDHAGSMVLDHGNIVWCSAADIALIVLSGVIGAAAGDYFLFQTMREWAPAGQVFFLP